MATRATFALGPCVGNWARIVAQVVERAMQEITEIYRAQWKRRRKLQRPRLIAAFICNSNYFFFSSTRIASNPLSPVFSGRCVTAGVNMLSPFFAVAFCDFPSAPVILMTPSDW
jgi:hypothetical protein